MNTAERDQGFGFSCHDVADGRRARGMPAAGQQRLATTRRRLAAILGG